VRLGPRLKSLAGVLPPEELNRIGFWLYERFRSDVPGPDVPGAVRGWVANGELRIGRTVTVAD
jgi:hypothetical protein